jgi:hypothetical protein
MTTHLPETIVLDDILRPEAVVVHNHLAFLWEASPKAKRDEVKEGDVVLFQGFDTEDLERPADAPTYHFATVYCAQDGRLMLAISGMHTIQGRITVDDPEEQFVVMVPRD